MVDRTTTVSLEICVDSVRSAIEAEKGGAHRLELCSSLVEGGITPSTGLIRTVVSSVRIPVFVLVRPRGGDFLYTNEEITVMEEDIRVAKDCGAAGVVVGALTENGSICMQTMSRLLKAAKPLEVTFHRAIDVARCPIELIRDLVSLKGVNRILTSGGSSDALQGKEKISLLVETIKTMGADIQIMAGAGINEENAKTIIEETGCMELHASLRSPVESRMQYLPDKPVFMGGEKLNDKQSEYIHKYVDSRRVEALLGTFQT